MICLKFLESQGELTLEDILEHNYHDNFIIHAFQDKYSLTNIECMEILQTLKTHLWIHNKWFIEYNQSFRPSPNIAITEMWLIFVAHTQEYAKFSYHLFNKFIPFSTPEMVSLELEWDMLYFEEMHIPVEIKLLVSNLDKKYTIDKLKELLKSNNSRTYAITDTLTQNDLLISDELNYAP